MKMGEKDVLRLRRAARAACADLREEGQSEYDAQISAYENTYDEWVDQGYQEDQIVAALQGFQSRESDAGVLIDFPDLMPSTAKKANAMPIRRKPRPAGAVSYDGKTYRSIAAAADAYAASEELDEGAFEPGEKPEFAAKLIEQCNFEDAGESPLLPIVLGDLEVGDADVEVPLEVWREACRAALAKRIAAVMKRNRPRFTVVGGRTFRG